MVLQPKNFIPAITANSYSTPAELIAFAESDADLYLKNESKADRFRLIYLPRDATAVHVNRSQEYEKILSTSFCATAPFALFGFIYGRSAASQVYLERVKHKTFETTKMAHRKYIDARMFGAVRYAIKFGFISFAFMGLIEMTQSLIACYRGKSGPFDYAGGAGITGAIFRAKLGIPGMISGGVIAGFMGLVGGILLHTVAEYTENTFEQRHRRFIIEECLEKQKLTHQIRQNAVELGAEKVDMEDTNAGRYSGGRIAKFFRNLLPF